MRAVRTATHIAGRRDGTSSVVLGRGFACKDATETNSNDRTLPAAHTRGGISGRVPDRRELAFTRTTPAPALLGHTHTALDGDAAPLCTLAHWRSPSGRAPHGTLQLPLRQENRRQMDPQDRGHRSRALSSPTVSQSFSLCPRPARCRVRSKAFAPLSNGRVSSMTMVRAWLLTHTPMFIPPFRSWKARPTWSILSGVFDVLSPSLSLNRCSQNVSTSTIHMQTSCSMYVSTPFISSTVSQSEPERTCLSLLLLSGQARGHP